MALALIRSARRVLDSSRLPFVSFDTLVRQSLPRNLNTAIALFDQAGIALIHVPKNGGSSIEQALYGQKIGHHRCADLARAAPVRFQKWRKIAVVRDPVDRFLSAFDYLSRGGRNAHDAEFARRIIGRRDINAFLASFPPEALRWFHFRPQSDYVTWRGGVAVDELIPFPRLAERMAQLTGSPLERLNVTAGPRTARADLSKASRDVLHSVYAADFALYQRAKQ